MLRDKSLIPLSRQHQHALALCVRIDRARPISAEDLLAWQKDIEQQFELEIKIHFSAEEIVLFPAARKFPALNSLVEDLLADHASLREAFLQAADRSMSLELLVAFARQLSDHIRKEERQLFESLQQFMTANELAELGAKLEDALKDAVQACTVRSDATWLKPNG